MVVVHLDTLNYDGPVCLSCDDTKLLSSLQLYYDRNKKEHFLVGAIGGPLLVPNIDDMKAIMANPSVVKATKVHVVVHMPHPVLIFLLPPSKFSCGVFRSLCPKSHLS